MIDVDDAIPVGVRGRTTRTAPHSDVCLVCFKPDNLVSHYAVRSDSVITDMTGFVCVL